MQNLKLQQLIDTITGLCSQVVNDGVPVKAVELALKDILHDGLIPLSRVEIQKELKELEEQSKAKPVGEQKLRQVTEGKDE